MREKKTLAQRVSGFLAGRGFYIVLLACAAVIGASAWTLMFPRGAKGGSYVDYSEPGAVTPLPEREILPSEVAEPETETDADEPRPEKTAEEPAVEIEPAAIPAAADEPAAQSAPGPVPYKTLADLTFARPIAGEITMPYSVDALVYSRTMGDWRTHAGIDISGALGAKVQAVCDGTVTEISSDDMLGTTVVIDHGFGLQSVYANLAAEPTVKAGDNVSLGSVIGSIGDTALGESGEVTHLHFGMTLEGENRNPLEYIP
jgi:murein DD-endopeptidase MepM/ murein hydrolase activator NlpD